MEIAILYLMVSKSQNRKNASYAFLGCHGSAAAVVEDDHLAVLAEARRAVQDLLDVSTTAGERGQGNCTELQGILNNCIWKQYKITLRQYSSQMVFVIFVRA